MFSKSEERGREMFESLFFWKEGMVAFGKVLFGKDCVSVSPTIELVSTNIQSHCRESNVALAELSCSANVHVDLVRRFEIH